MKQYHTLLEDILNNGEKKHDRTNTGTISVFGRQLRFDLSKGFPAITTKKLAWKSVVSELLWFIEGSGDERRLAEILYGRPDSGRNTIWTGNAQAAYWKPRSKFSGDLERVYGVQWRKWERYNEWKSSVVLIEQGTKIGNNSGFTKNIPLENPNYNNADDLVGKIFSTKACGDILVLEKLSNRAANSYYRVQFLSGINSIVECSRPNIKSGSVKNPYAMTVAYGNGCYGIIEKKHKYTTHAYNMWYNMMQRCHGDDPQKTLEYKSKGIFVDSDWRCFANFYRDIHGLIGFRHWCKSPHKFDLDKDYFGNNFYGVNSTIFLPSEYNKLLAHPTNDGRLLTAINKNTGEVFNFTSPTFFNEHTNTKSMVDRAFRDQKGETRNWKFNISEPPPGYKWRQQFYVDQLQNVITSIKNDPNGRRHIISAWNVGELDEMALPPCHVMSQFYVSNGKLSCHMYQRSCDTYLGIPFNIASYALLTHMIARECELDVGELVISTGDTHIYLNHIDQVKEQLSREEYPLPTLWLNPNIKRVVDFTMETIELDNYKCHATLKAEMAV
jgi:thymidylate synthase